MIDALLCKKQSEPKEFCIHYNGTGLEMLKSHSGYRTNKPEKEKRELKPCKSFYLGIYPSNIITEEIYGD